MPIRVRPEALCMTEEEIKQLKEMKPVKIILTKEEWDRMMEILETPREPSQELIDLLSISFDK